MGGRSGGAFAEGKKRRLTRLGEKVGRLGVPKSVDE